MIPPFNTELQPGMILLYRPAPEDLPLDPSKTWRGKVIQCNDENVLVEMLEPGYHALQETINYSQIVAVEPR